MRGYKKCAAVLLTAALSAALAACQKPNEDIAAKTEKAHIVSFTWDELTFNQQLVVSGKRAAVPEPALPGYYLHHWENENHAVTDPGDIVISQDTTFNGILYPAFQNTAVYLFPDSNGWFHPNDPLTCSQLQAAFEALSPAEAQQIVADILNYPEEAADQAVTKEQLTAIYMNDKLFPEEQGKAAVQVLPEGDVTRDAFAKSICILLNRDWENQPVKILDNQQVPGDIDPLASNIGYLLDSCIGHTIGTSTDSNIQNAVMDMPWEEGFHLQNGFLYYANSEGQLLRDEALGNLYFGENGRYTTNDPELDELSAKLISEFQQGGTVTDRYELLYAAFAHVRDNMVYVRREKLKFRETGWANRLGKEALTTYKGNCFHYAAAFTVLARGLGYDAQEISGQGFEPLMPHGWVDIYINGEQLIFDPQTAAKETVYHARENWNEDMFAVPMYKKNWWRYTW